MGEKIFVKYVGDEGDIRLRFRISTRKGRPVGFLVQLEIALGKGWKPVVRYDTAHGFAHRDVLSPTGKAIEKRALRLSTLEEALEYAEQDLTDRADWYVENFRRMKR